MLVLFCRGVDQHGLFKDAPFCMQTELALSVNGDNLRKVIETKSIKLDNDMVFYFCGCWGGGGIR